MFKKPPLNPSQASPRRRPKTFPYFLLLVTIFCVWLVWSSLNPKLPSPSEPPRLYSNQAGLDLRLTLMNAIRKADQSIYMVMFGLSDPAILGALTVKIKERVNTTIYYDPIGSPDVRKLLGNGEIHPIRNPGLMHQKILVIDDEIVFIGSANFTTASLKMHDNLVLGFVNQKLAHFLKEKGPLASGNLRTMVGGQDMEFWLLPDPKGHALSEIKKKIRSAGQSIHLALFTFTHEALASELIRAKRRGVDVSVVIDLYSGIGASSKVLEILKGAGVKVSLSQGGKLLHHKFALIDDKTLIMGSANWTKAAFTKNSDCILFLYNLRPDQKKLMTRLWRRIEKESKKH